LSEGGAGLFFDLGGRIAATLARLSAAAEVTVGCTPKQPVWSRGKTTLYRYLPRAAPESVPPAGGRRVRGKRARKSGPSQPRSTPPAPVLICFALVNRPYVLDLQPDASLVRRLLEAGLSVYLIDWGEPDDSDRGRDLEDYLERALGGCVEHVRVAHATDAVNLLGVCQGGVLSLCYTALHPQHVRNLVTLTTAVDFQTPDDLLSRWVRGVDTELLARCGNVPGAVLNALFLSLMPFRLTQQKYVRLLLSGADQHAVEEFARLERWIFDSPPQAAAALMQYVRWFYQENRLARGTLEIGGRLVDLRRIRQPLLNLYASADHIVPAQACAVMGRHVGSRDYTACAIDTGHIGMYVSRRARAQIPARIIDWLRARS
jgi:polyhydroxyalkanoate synthase subunit PhaC